MDRQQTRAVFARQPAHILLVDFSPPFTDEICHNIHKSLEEMFALVCSMPGPSRIPFFGLYALGSHAENLLPLQHVKGNFQRLYNALQELRSFPMEGHLMLEPSENLGQALHEATVQFKRQAQTLRQMTGFTAQLEVTILTCQMGASISKQIDGILREMDLTSLRRIQVAVIQHRPSSMALLDQDSIVEDSQGSGSPSVRSLEVMRSPANQSPTSDPLALGAVEIISLEQDELSLQEFFRSWLHDVGTDREYLHLRLPLTGKGDDWLTLKCDLQERFINASLLPFQAQFDIHTNQVPGRSVTNQAASSKSAVVNASILVLNAAEMVKVSGICDSVVFGMPLIVRPTSCWKLDWDELESNQQHFHALCHLLQERNLALVARLDTDSPPSAHLTPKPQGHFVLLPSPTLSLLLKPIAVQELMLPIDCGRREELPIAESIKSVAACLDQLEVSDMYNPLATKSQVHRSLMGMLVRSTGTRQLPGTSNQFKRKLPEAKEPSRPCATGFPSGAYSDTPGVAPRGTHRYHRPLTMQTTTYYQNTP